MTKPRNIRRRNRFVAMLDVMGTKSLIGQRQDKCIFDLMESIRTIEKEYSTNDYVRMTFYSDSIILYTIDNCEKSYKSILYTSAHIVKFFLKQGFGINGCISYGVCTCDYKDGKYITIGQPFVDAYLLQDDLLCYGVALDEKAVKKIDKEGYNADFCPFLLDSEIRLKIPTKKKGWVEISMINWMEFLTSGEGDLSIQKDEVKKIILELYKRYSNVGKGAYYIQNTEIVLKQWYDFLAERNGFKEYSWGERLSEEYLTKCPYVSGL